MSTDWTERDDDRLRAHLERANGKVSWVEIARAAFPDGKYSKAECMERWKGITKPRPLRGPWTKDEDLKLEALVARYGSEKWVVIATEMATRSGKQCRERWHNHLDPTINKGEWTPEEDELIHRLYAKIGSRWAEMAKHLPGRPDNAIKNYWNASLIRQKRRRGNSISSLTGALDISASDGSPTMTRSSSSNSLTGAQRFTPYVRSSPMSKSRSESVSMSSAMFSPYRREAGEPYSPSSFTSPYQSPGMTRSQSFGAPAYSPSTPSQVRQHPLPPPPLHIVSRDLSKEMVDPAMGYPGPLHTGNDTPPATPDRSPMVRHHTNSSPPLPNANGAFPFYHSPPSPPSSSASSIFFNHPSVEQVFGSTTPTSEWGETVQHQTPFPDSLGFDGLPPFQHLHIGDAHFDLSNHSAVPEHSSYLYDASLASSPLVGHGRGHTHSFSYDGPPRQPLHEHHHIPHSHSLQHSMSHEAHSQQPTFGSSTTSRSPFVHPHHQLGASPEYEYHIHSHQSGSASPAIDEWGHSLSSPLLLEEPQPHLVLAPSPQAAGDFGSGYQAPSYEEIEAAAERARSSRLQSSVTYTEEYDSKPVLRRQESHVSSASFASTGSPHSPYSQSSSAEQSPHSAAFPSLTSPANELSVAVGVAFDTAAANHSPPVRLSSRPSSRQHRLASLAAPISLSSTGSAMGFESTPLQRTASSPVPSVHRSERLSNYEGPSSASRYRATEGPRIRTDGGLSSASPSSKPKLGSSASWSVRHPTSNLMEVDKNGRACLPGMASR